MLGERVTREIIDQLWDSLGCKIALPKGEEEYLREKESTPAVYLERRRFHRFNFRQRAIMEKDGVPFAIYTKDISREPLGFLHAEQLFPCECVTVCLRNGRRLPLEIVRCRRLAEHCYECCGTYAKDSPENQVPAAAR